MKRDNTTASATCGSSDLKRKKKNKREQPFVEAPPHAMNTISADNIEVNSGNAQVMMNSETDGVDHTVGMKRKKNKKGKIDEQSYTESEQRDGSNNCESMEPSRDATENFVLESRNSIDIDGVNRKTCKKIIAADTKASDDGSVNRGDEKAANVNSEGITVDTAAIVRSSIFSEETFESLPLSSHLQKALKEMNFSKMTQIQAKSIPECLAGSDLIGAAKTGRYFMSAAWIDR